MTIKCKRCYQNTEGSAGGLCPRCYHIAYPYSEVKCCDCGIVLGYSVSDEMCGVPIMCELCQNTQIQKMYDMVFRS